MNIAAPNASAGTPAPAATFAQVAVGSDVDPIDRPAGADGKVPLGFGALLSLSIVTIDETAAATVPSAVSGVTALPAFPAAAVPLELDADSVAAVRGAPEPTIDEEVPTDGPPDRAVADDLASQLALVSQWAGLAPAATARPATAAAPAATATSGKTVAADPLGIRSKLDAMRANLARHATTTPTAATVPDGSPTTVTTAVRAEPAIGAAATDPTDFARDAVPEFASLIARTDAPATIEAPTTPADLTGLLASVTSRTSLTATTPGATAVPRSIDAAVGTPAWSNEVGQATLRIAASDLQGATLQLNPDHLGPLDVQIRIDHGVAHLAFQAAHADTRQAIEASRASLEQLFAEQGLKIGDCAVGDAPSRGQTSAGAGGQADSEAARRAASAGGGAFGAAGAERAPIVAVPRTVRGLGMVDTFA